MHPVVPSSRFPDVVPVPVAVTAAPPAEVLEGGMTDATLVRRALDGDGAAYTALVDRHAPTCLRFASRMLGSRDDAEDATQETFIRAYKALASFDERYAFRTWLLSILANRCRTALLHRTRRLKRVVRDEEAMRHATVEPADLVELDAPLRSALEALDPAQREAFLLKYVEQLEYDEIAEITGAGVSALKMRVKRARERLRRLLDGGRDVSG
jgi:RNA polymerase sigma-70 factor (ECF subfamily)